MCEEAAEAMAEFINGGSSPAIRPVVLPPIGPPPPPSSAGAGQVQELRRIYSVTVVEHHVNFSDMYY